MCIILRELPGKNLFEVFVENEEVGKLRCMSNNRWLFRLNEIYINENNLITDELRGIHCNTFTSFEEAKIAITSASEPNRLPLDPQLANILENSVYYPCSCFHGKPLEILGKLCPNFLYADDGVDRGEVERVCHEEPPCGYHPVHFEELEPAELHLGDFQFVAHSHFERLSDFSDAHGPNQINLIFTDSEGVKTYESVYNHNEKAPICLVLIRSHQISYGDLVRAMKDRQAEPPKYLLIDTIQIGNEDFLPALDHYTPLRYWIVYRPNYGDTNYELYIFAVRQPTPIEDELAAILENLLAGTDCIGRPWTDFQGILEMQKS